MQRLHLVTQNARFVILPAFQCIPNLASRVLGLSLQRLAQDMQREHGHRVLLAESFQGGVGVRVGSRSTGGAEPSGGGSGLAGTGAGGPPPAAQLCSLFDGLGDVEDYRRARGQRYSLRTVLTLAIAARLAGYRGVTAFVEFAALLDQRQRREVG